MTALIWMLTGLPLVLPAISLLPAPVNVILMPSHSSYFLKWDPGPGTPAGVYYHVSIGTDKGTSLVPVTGCERVQQPLVCNLTKEFHNLMETYIIKVTAQLEAQTSAVDQRFKPTSHISLPLMTITSCGRVLCVDLQPAMEHQYHQESYDVLHYQLQITSNDGKRFFKDIRSLKREILEDLAPGRNYCVSIRFSDNVEGRESNFSQPVCALTLGIFSADPLISVVLCLLVAVGAGVMVCLVYAGSICLRRRPLPSVLVSIHHIEEVLVAPNSVPLFSDLNLKPMSPSAAEKRNRLSLSDESDEESTTETSGGSTGGGYKLRGGDKLLSSSSSSSSLSAPSSPKPKQPSGFFIQQPEAQISTDTHSNAGLSHSRRTDSHSLTEERIEEEEVVGEGDSQDVNLLTLTFGRFEEEVEKSHLDMPVVESFSAADECNATPILLSQTWGTKKVAIESVSCGVNEEMEEEEMDEYSGYMRRPHTNV